MQKRCRNCIALRQTEEGVAVAAAVAAARVAFHGQ